MSQAHADCPHCRQGGSEAKHIALKEVRIALAGNPNCGKTTAFNEYTGTHQHVGNYPGVTVDKKEGYVSIDGVEVLMVDLPGTYSLTAYSQEEIVTRAVLAPEKAEEKPMAVVDLVDTSALERNLFLTVQIMEMGLPVVLACNMMDEARKAGIQVDTKELGKQLGIPVVATVARSGEGLKDALREAVAFGRRGSAPLNISYGPDLDPVLTKMERLLAEKGLLTDRYPARWIALKVLENDSEILRQVERMPDVAAQLRADRETVADHLRDTLQTSPEAIIADYRYGFIRGVLRSGAVRRESAKDRLELSDKLDKVLTNTLFGPLIMLGVLYAMFQLTFVIGAYPQGWVEDGFGWLGETVSALMPDGFLKSLIVSGVMIGYICSAVTDFVVTFADDSNIVNLHNWSLGSFSGISWEQVQVMSGLVAAAVLLVFAMSKQIGAYQLGENYARSMGVNIRLFRAGLILLSSLLSACVTAFAGPISFVGIAVPHLIKGLFRSSRPLILIPGCFLGGALVCLLCDMIARTVFAPVELSISSVTALFGAPVVIWLMVDRRKGGR